MIFLSLIHNVSLLITLSIIYGIIFRHFYKKTPYFSIVSGLLFGCVSVIGMMTPMTLMPGIIFDGRSIILFIAGFSGGPVTAVIAAMMAGAYRIWLGGAGTLMGVSVISESALCGIALHYLKVKSPFFNKIYWIWIFGMLVHILMLALTIALPGGLSWFVFEQIALPVIVIYPIATFIVGLLIGEIESHFLAIVTLKETQKELESAQERAHIGSWVLDPFTQKGFWSREMYRLFYMDPHEGFPNQTAFLEHIHPEDRDILKNDLISATQSVMQIKKDYRTNPKYGPIKVINAQFCSETDEHNKIIRLVGTCLDITERKLSEDNLRSERARLRTLIHSIPDMIWLKNPQGVYLVGNPKFEEFIGIKESDLIGKTDYDLFEPELAEFFRQHDQRAVLAQKPSVNEEWVTFASNGHHALLETVKTPLFDEDKKLLGVLGIAREITERFQSEELLKKSETRFRELFEHSPVAYQSLDDKGFFIDVNQKLCDLLGYSVDELLGKKFSELWSLDTQEKFPEVFSCFLQEDKTQGELRLNRKDGKLIIVLLEGRIQRDAQGKFMRTHCILHDITEQKRMEEELMRAQSIAHVGNWSYDVRNKIFVGSDEWYKIFGLAQNKFTDESFFESVFPEDIQRVRQGWESILAGNPKAIEYRLMINNQVKWVYSKADVERDSEGHISQIRGIVQDITEQKKAEEERIQLDSKMRDIQKLESLGILAGGMAHDFNNILMAILGHASLAAHELPQKSPLCGNLSEIEKAARQASDICQQMLAYSGRGRFLVQKININDLISDMANLLKTSISKKAELKLLLDKSIPLIEGDTTQIRQVVMNLIINASESLGEQNGYISLTTGVKFCDQSYLDELMYRADLKEGLYTFLQVSDTGLGMDEHVIKHLFDPFFTTKFTGRGLGLAAVLGIIRGHHGGIKILSTPGKGSTFTVYFPIIGEKDEEIIEKMASTQKNWKAEGTVLLVDDEESVRAVAKLMLEKIGYSVFTASNGEEALQIYQKLQNQIHYVLLDLTMPQMDGEETYNELIKIRPGVKVILTSGFTEQEISTRFKSKGLSGFIQKPYTLSGLRDCFKSIPSDPS